MWCRPSERKRVNLDASPKPHRKSSWSMFVQPIYLIYSPIALEFFLVLGYIGQLWTPTLFIAAAFLRRYGAVCDFKWGHPECGQSVTWICQTNQAMVSFLQKKSRVQPLSSSNSHDIIAIREIVIKIAKIHVFVWKVQCDMILNLDKN